MDLITTNVVCLRLSRYYKTGPTMLFHGPSTRPVKTVTVTTQVEKQRNNEQANKKKT